MAKGDSHMAKNVAKESGCIAPTLHGPVVSHRDYFEWEKKSSRALKRFGIL
jgi:hypothetical protein